MDRKTGDLFACLPARSPVSLFASDGGGVSVAGCAAAGVMQMPRAPSAACVRHGGVDSVHPRPHNWVLFSKIQVDVASSWRSRSSSRRTDAGENAESARPAVPFLTRMTRKGSECSHRTSSNAAPEKKKNIETHILAGRPSGHYGEHLHRVHCGGSLPRARGGCDGGDDADDGVDDIMFRLDESANTF